jgi:hypothetical protein
MATAATVKQVQVKQTKPKMVEASLERVPGAGEDPAATRSTIPDRCTVQERGKTSFQWTVPKPVVVPGAYSGKPVALQMAAVILQKGYLGFYLHLDERRDQEEGVSRSAEAIEGQDVFPCEDVGRSG